ncbi:methionyl-tRNA formyltransferase [Pikeienuella piscinae]|uniref:Methionyl-tRNA formyltransferase n=1 Tax=Pikeienuella piscinae TaxID=2748098 RepID=A0A7M3T757_9RHOB|nr:methionyl-tRNA formyltransferase [Pikeienuella piscinae]
MVDCRYLVSERDGRKVLQLNTYGSANRQIPNKLSQTIQFDEESARSLWRILSTEFGFKG